MIIAYKNYKRTERVGLCIKSVKHFLPEANIHCLFLYDENPDEYGQEIQDIANLGVTIHFNKNKYKMGPGVNSPANGLYYTEYLNYFHQMFTNEEKVIAMDEDMYFTTGRTLKWFNQTEFDLAFGKWWIGINAGIIGINFKKLGVFFPLPEKQEFIEGILQEHLYNKAFENNFILKQIPTRCESNYFGDGSYTNDTQKIKNDLIEANII